MNTESTNPATPEVVTKESKPKKAAKPSAKKASTSNAKNSKTPAPKTTTPAAPKATKPKAIKVNPSASYIGFAFSSPTPISVNYRQGKKNIVECTEVKCTGANATGRRLNVSYTTVDGKSFERRVYKEYFEKAARIFGAMLPE